MPASSIKTSFPITIWNFACILAAHREALSPIRITAFGLRVSRQTYWLGSPLMPQTIQFPPIMILPFPEISNLLYIFSPDPIVTFFLVNLHIVMKIRPLTRARNSLIIHLLIVIVYQSGLYFVPGYPILIHNQGMPHHCTMILTKAHNRHRFYYHS